VRDCIYLNISPINGTSLKSLLHTRGINNRYIGKIAMLAKSREDLDHLHLLVHVVVANLVQYVLDYPNTFVHLYWERYSDS
uniref:CLU central domain-containing protein n=1 Tax=Amphimedon queenslandica TaxID=400682 RepID=A0A1X7SJA9_AMPQE